MTSDKAILIPANGLLSDHNHNKIQNGRHSKGSNGNGNELFPSRKSAAIFCTYVGLYVIQQILTKATQNADHSYSYNTMTVVLATEVTKLFLATGWYLQQGHRLAQLPRQLSVHSRLMIKYLIPAALYCLYNNLSYYNLSSFDPTTYVLLLQSRVVITGVIYQLLFRKRLSRIQWISLLLLTLGCMIKEVLDTSSATASQHRSSRSTAVETTIASSSYPWTAISLVLIQVLCSCAAGVYNEFLLKGKSSEHATDDGGRPVADLMIQNIFMYLDSILCNLVAFIMVGKPQELFQAASYQSLAADPRLWVLILLSATYGLVTSAFLLYLNSIEKSFASAIELLILALLCWVIFGIPVGPHTLVAILLVSAAVMLYSKYPIRKPALPNSTSFSDEPSGKKSSSSVNLLIDHHLANSDNNLHTKHKPDENSNDLIAKYSLVSDDEEDTLEVIENEDDQSDLELITTKSTSH